MDAEHAVVDAALVEARTAWLRFQASASAADAQAATAAMTQLQEVTLAHFEHEEVEVEPIIGGVFGLPYRRRIAPVWRT